MASNTVGSGEAKLGSTVAWKQQDQGFWGLGLRVYIGFRVLGFWGLGFRV